MILDPQTALQAMADYNIESYCLNGYKLNSVHIISLDDYYKFRLSKYYPNIYSEIVNYQLGTVDIDRLDSAVLQFIIQTVLSTDGVIDIQNTQDLVYIIINSILKDITNEDTSIYYIADCIINIYKAIQNDREALCINNIKTMDSAFIDGKYYIINEVCTDFNIHNVSMRMVVSHYIMGDEVLYYD